MPSLQVLWLPHYPLCQACRSFGCPTTHHAERVAESAGLLVAKARQGPDAAEGGRQVSHLMTLRVAGSGGGPVAPQQRQRRDAIEVVVLGRVRWSGRDNLFTGDTTTMIILRYVHIHTRTT
jgi:hypothetical protein